MLEGKSCRLQCIETGGESNKNVLQKPYQTSKLKAKDNRGLRNWHDRTKFLIDVSEADQTLYHLVHRQHQQHCQIKYHFNLHVIFIVILIIFLHEQSQSYWGAGGGGDGEREEWARLTYSLFCLNIYIHWRVTGSQALPSHLLHCLSHLIQILGMIFWFLKIN